MTTIKWFEWRCKKAATAGGILKFRALCPGRNLNKTPSVVGCHSSGNNKLQIKNKKYIWKETFGSDFKKILFQMSLGFIQRPKKGWVFIF